MYILYTNCWYNFGLASDDYVLIFWLSICIAKAIHASKNHESKHDRDRERDFSDLENARKKNSVNFSVQGFNKRAHDGFDMNEFQFGSECTQMCGATHGQL